MFKLKIVVEFRLLLRGNNTLSTFRHQILNSLNGCFRRAELAASFAFPSRISPHPIKKANRDTISL